MLILRELLVLAQGQELKLALGLWGWLWWTGLGALLGGRGLKPAATPKEPSTAKRDQSERGVSRAEAAPAGLGRLLTLLGLLLPATILAIRAVPFGGQSLPLGRETLLYLALLAPFGLVSGYFFSCACRAWEGQGPAGAPGRVYGLETLGAALGVVLLQLVLLGRYPSLGLGLGTGLFLVLGARFLDRTPGLIPRLGQLLVMLLLLLGLTWLTPLEQLSRGWQAPARQLAASVDSPYAFLSAAREDGQVSFFVNNLWQFTYPDPLTAERQVQTALLVHPQPRRVLLLGGGVGLLPEMLKTASLTRLEYVELDPRLVELARDLLPGAGAWLRDPRVRLSHQDARHFVARGKERYDVILMALPEPRSAQLNRFYSQEFFRLVADRLAPGGVFSFSLGGSETSLHPWRAAFLAMAYRTLGQVFPEVLVWPGERVQFFAAAAPGVLTADPELLAARIAARRLPLQYVRDYYLREELRPSRVAYLKQVLEGQPVTLNTDLAPGCYFYALGLEGIQADLPLGQMLAALKRLPAFIPWTLLAVAILGLGACLRPRPGGLYLYQVTVMGLGTMSLEILVLILYQIQLGSLYRQLGLLIAAFMAGMGAGAAVGGALVGTGAGRPERAGRALAGLQLLLALLALLLAQLLSRNPLAAFEVPEYLVQVGFALVLTAAGFGGGGIFALSAGLWVRSRGESGVKGGVLYAADLLGSALGTLGVSFFILPVWGIWPALILVAALHAGAALPLLVRPAG